ncbi:hypothetical protein AB1L30_26855 [Bremerella sp. JC817]|uniref:hypothetical protein n=1 Tax=Bremerella sp. JC817 TaxID=3231756 RepID=UPI003457B5C8
MNSEAIPREWLTAPTTVDEILATCSNPDPAVAEMARHYLNQAGGLFQQMVPGDELWNYSTPDAAWAANQGQAGLAVLREGQIVDSVCMARN